VPVAVERDLVPRVGDRPCDHRVLAHLLADEKERRAGAALLERLEDGGGPARMRAVVERECNCVPPHEAAVDADLAGQPIRMSREWRRDPARSDHASSASTVDAAEGSAASVGTGAGLPASARRSATRSS